MTKSMHVQADNVKVGDKLLTTNGMREVLKNDRKGPLHYITVEDACTQQGETTITYQPTDMVVVQPPYKGDEPYKVDVSSRRGAPMGRRSIPIPDGSKVKLRRMPFVDGCYDQGGAYWGAPANVWCCWGNSGVHYLRAYSRSEAKAELIKLYNGLRFYR